MKIYSYFLIQKDLNLIRNKLTIFIENLVGDKLGQLVMTNDECFAFDPAHNILEQESHKIRNNQVTEYQGMTYRYGEFGNLSQRTFSHGEVQSYRYNLKDQLIEAQIQKPNQPTEVWQYQYDVLDKRIGKVRSKFDEF